MASRGFDFERPAKGCRGGLEIELLEAGDADVVRPVRIFARGDGARRWLRRGARSQRCHAGRQRKRSDSQVCCHGSLITRI